MTNSTHTYEAVLIGSPDVPLTITGGRLTLDERSTRHVQGEIELGSPDEAVQVALDPRLGARIRLTATAVFPSGVQSRVFDLGVRARPVAHDDRGSVSVSVASDEALLDDSRAIADDSAPLAHQDSLYDLVDYVLGAAIPGALLDRVGSAADVAVPALSDSQNLIRNPRCASNTTDWFATWSVGSLTTGRFDSGGPAYSPSRWYMLANSNTTGAYTYITDAAVSITPGKTYMLSIDTRSATGVNLSIDAWMLDAAGSIVGATTPVARASVASTWFRDSIIFTVPSTATKLRPRVAVVGTLASGVAVEVTAVRLSEYNGDPADVGYFDGGSAATSQYTYGWPPNATAHAAPSTRTAIVDAATPDALTWRAGDTALEFLHPIVQRFGLRLVCDESRTWTLRDANYNPGIDTLSIMHGVNLIEGSDVIDIDAGLWFDARVTRYRWTTPDGVQMERVDAYAPGGTPVRVAYVEVNAAYPGPGRSEHAVRAAQGLGREVTATIVADWRTKAEQTVRIVLENAPLQVGEISQVSFDLSDDEMTVTSRTTEIQDGAIELLVGTIDSLVGTIDSL